MRTGFKFAYPRTLENSKTTESFDKPASMKLRILTFNVFFDEVARSVRMKAIGRLVERTRPAVIGFQEVTREALALLKAQSWAQFYDCSVDTALPLPGGLLRGPIQRPPRQVVRDAPVLQYGDGQRARAHAGRTHSGLYALRGDVPPRESPQFAGPRVAQLKESLTLLRDRVNNAESDDVVVVGGKRQLHGQSSPSVCLGAVFMGDTNLLRADMKLLDRRLTAFADVDVELAKSGRSKCRKCRRVLIRVRCGWGR